MSGPVSIEPPAELQNDIFPLKANHMVLLQKYVNSGVQLPVTVEEYTKEFTLAAVTVAKFQENVDSIVKVYGECRAHTRHFKDIVLPKTISLASDLISYSNDAKVYYNAIFVAVQDLDIKKNPNLSPEEVQRRKDRVNAVVDEQVATIDAMVLKSAEIVASLKTFEEETTGDQASLQREQKVLSGKLEDTDGEIAGLIKELQDIQRAIDTSQKAYEETLDKISEIPIWGWVPFVGWVAAVVLGNSWTESAKALAKKMNQDKSRMDAKQAEIASCQNMDAQAQTMNRDLKRLLDQIKPAIETIQLMQGAFGSISDDLNIVRNKVNDDIRDAKAIIADLQIEIVLDSWKSLGLRGEQYRQVAYVGILEIEE